MQILSVASVKLLQFEIQNQSRTHYCWCIPKDIAMEPVATTTSNSLRIIFCIFLFHKHVHGMILVSYSFTCEIKCTFFVGLKHS